VLLVAADMPYPEPLHALRPLPDVFAFALLLVPDVAAAPWRLQVALSEGSDSAHCDGDGLEQLRRSIPAARALPLLQAMARGRSASMIVEAGGLDLALQLETAA
jgi:hypothetical protein